MAKEYFDSIEEIIRNTPRGNDHFKVRKDPGEIFTSVTPDTASWIDSNPMLLKIGGKKLKEHVLWSNNLSDIKLPNFETKWQKSPGSRINPVR